MKPLTDLDGLPHVLPIIPLQGLIVLPRSILPLPIFDEPRVAILQGLARRQELIGVVQPKPSEDDESLSLFDTGCAVQILSVTTLHEDHALLTIQGLCRFKILKEFP